MRRGTDASAKPIGRANVLTLRSAATNPAGRSRRGQLRQSALAHWHPVALPGQLRIGGWTLHEGPSASTVIPTQSFESLVSRRFRDAAEPPLGGSGEVAPPWRPALGALSD